MLTAHPVRRDSRPRLEWRRWLTLILVGALLALGQTALAPHASADDIPTQDQVRAALVSAPGSNLFWTGRIGSCQSEADSVKPITEKYAKQRGQKTLEMRLADAGLKMPPFDTPDNKAKDIWRFASAEYARQTSDQAWVIKGKCVRKDNTWDTRELPELENRGKVKCIWEIDAGNLAHEKLLWNAWWWGSTCKGQVHLHNSAALACVPYDEQDLDEGFKWRHYDQQGQDSWSYLYGWAYIGGEPWFGKRDSKVDPNAYGYQYSIEPDDSGPANPSYHVNHSDRLIAWFLHHDDRRPYLIQVYNYQGGYSPGRPEPYNDVCNFETALRTTDVSTSAAQCGATDDKTCNVMVVGDSISNGYEGDATWRYRLWEWAQDQNWQARFVGPLTGTEKQNAAHPPEPPPLVENPPAPPPAQPDPSQFTGAYAQSDAPGFVQGDSGHYAMWGRALGQDVGTIELVMAAQGAQGHLPDVLLVELGFNDIGWQGAGAGLVDTMRKFVDNARNANPHVKIVLANVPQRTTLGDANPQLPQRTRDYDAALAQAAPGWSTPDSPVVIADVDKAMGCDPSSKTCATAYDGLHPNPLGEYRIAAAFGTALHDAFGIGTAAPEAPASVPDRQVTAPTDLVFDGSQQGVTVTWGKIVGAHSYDVQWREVVDGAEKPWEDAVPAAQFNRWDLPWQFSFQPVDGHRYEVRVREVAGDADDLKSAWSQPVSGIAHPTTPKPPDEVTAQAAGPGEIDVSWTPVHDDSLTRYAVYVYDTDTPAVFAKVYGYAPTVSPLRRITGLTPGHHYQVYMCGWNASGEGMPHIAEGTVVP
ncbi:GDSL-type esterase/lipase family protein [Streptomyces sp. NPDC002573]|uniref:GDSL-type esterase/lipase family protein n=1 Tax=Streptomyces sp. NPDC002573 TaxID=3364651 RepID=UPI0036ABAEA7